MTTMYRWAPEGILTAEHTAAYREIARGADAGVATPGPSGSFAPATPGAAFDPNSFLANLSSYMPLINQLLQASQPVQSGQGNAQAQPAAQAAPGLDSATLGAMAPAGAPAPAAIAPAIAPLIFDQNVGSGDSGGAAGAPGPGGEGP